MKASKWSESGASPTVPVGYTVTVADDVVQIVLKMPGTGAAKRLRIVLTRSESDELAACIKTPEPKVVKG